jgi:hypothetical protein
VRFTPLLRGGVFAAALGAAALAQAREVPFAPPLPVYTPAGPVERWAPADIDGDADLDLLVAAPAEGRLLLLRNVDGAGASWSAVTVATSVSGPTDTVAGDVDGDGDLDALSASPSSTLLEWHENLDAAGTAWATHTIAAGGSFGLEVADIDRDGDLDVVALPNLAGSPLRWYQNGGGGAYWTPHTIGSVSVIEAGIDAVDIDRDGDLDLLTTYVGFAVWFENSNGGTTWSVHGMLINAATGFAAADIDRDGDPDVVGQNAWYENEPRAPWTPHSYATMGPFAPSMPTPADLDSDGDLDIWAHEHPGSIIWYENLTGDGLDWVRRVVATASSPTSATPVDLDGDGDLDALSASDVGIVRHVNETLHRSACFAPPLGVSTFADKAFTIEPADIDRDGDLDLVTSHPSADLFLWHENVASGASWTPHTLATSIDVPSAALAADVDGDGDTDVVANFQLTGLQVGALWLENQSGGATFTAHTIATASSFYGARIMQAGDIDGDGDVDVFQAGYGHSGRWYRNLAGDGSSWSSAIVVGGSAGQLADIDQDGDLDFASSTADFMISNNHVDWTENLTGNGATWAVHNIATNLNRPEVKAAADVDGDGDADILHVTVGEQPQWRFNQNAGASWTSQVITGMGFNPRPPFDLDRDGDLDVPWARGSNDAFGWHENLDGAGTAWAGHTLPLLGGLSGLGDIAAADIDRDGNLDLVANPVSLVWHPNRAGQYSLASTSTAPGTAQQGTLVSMLRVIATHLGRTGDGVLELVRFGILLEEAAGDPLTTAEANLLVESLRVYRDANGNGLFDPTDALVTSVGTLALAGGVQDVVFSDGGAHVVVALGAPQTYFVVVELTPDASTQNPNRLRATLLQLGPSASQAEHAAYDLPIAPACPADFSSGVTVATIPVELMGFTIE